MHRIIAFNVLFALIQKNPQIITNENKKEKKIFKITTTIQYIIILPDIFFTYLQIQPIFFPERIC